MSFILYMHAFLQSKKCNKVESYKTIFIAYMQIKVEHMLIAFVLKD